MAICFSPGEETSFMSRIRIFIHGDWGDGFE